MDAQIETTTGSAAFRVVAFAMQRFDPCAVRIRGAARFSLNENGATSAALINACGGDPGSWPR